MALLVTSAGTPLAVHIESITYDEKIDDPATCTFDVPDSVAYSLSQYQVVNVTDTVTSTLLYAGYIVSVADVAFPGNLGIRMRTITCTGNRWLAEKRYWTGPEFNGWTAGDVAAEVHRIVLAAEGVSAAYALRHDMDAASLGAGTLVGTTAANGVLTLAPAGTDFTKTESVTADFATGTLTNVAATGNALALSSFLAIKFTGSVGSNLDANALYTKRKIWAGTAYTIATGDIVTFDLWVTSSSPEIKASLDILFSDGSWASDSPTDIQDQWNIYIAPTTDLKGWADDQWFARSCIVGPGVVGKSIVSVYIVFAGTKGGDYTAYFKNAKITNSGGTVQRSFFSGADTVMAANVPSSTSGYFNVTASIVTVYAHDGNRVSPARSITSVGIVKGSVISWVEKDAAQASGGSNQYLPQVLIEASYDDGATFQTCTNHAALPGLIVGMNASGRTVTLRQTLAVGGPSPEMGPLLDTCSFTVFTAAAMTKTDFVDIDNSTATLGTGVLTNCTAYSNGLMTTGIYRDWTVSGPSDAPSYASQTLFGVSGAGNPQQGEAQNYFYLRTDSSLDCKSRFDFAGTWQNFVAEIDIELVQATGNSEYGFVYRTTGWVNANNTYAYAAQISGTHIMLNRAANGGTPAFTSIVSVALTLTTGSWYRMKIVVNGSNHKVFLNDFKFIDVTDATYSAAGNVGVRFWNNSGARDSGHFDNFGIVSYEADFISVSSRQTAAISLSGIVGSSIVNWNAIVPSTSVLLVESTIDAGTTWSTCTNGGQIPLLVPGFNAAGKNLKFRFTMTNQAVNIPIVLTGYSAFIIGQYSASGTRVSPVLAIGAAGTIGSSAVSWVATTPTGTGLVMAGSTDNITYTTIAASGNPIAGLVAQGALIADDFITNTSANYTSTFNNGGSVTTWTWDTANSRLTTPAATGADSCLVYNGVVAVDLYIEATLDQVANGGLACRRVDGNNTYSAYVYDASAAATPNTFALYKIVAGAYTLLASGPLAFVRGSYHTFRLSTVGTTISLLMDSIQLASVTDSSISAAGKAGLIGSNGNVGSRFYSMNILPLGASASGKNVYTRATLTSTDPTQNPVVSSIVTSVRSPDIMTGAQILGTKYQYTKKCSEILLDVAGQSKMYMRLDKNKSLKMKDRAYTPAPWPLYSADPLFLGPRHPPTATRQSPAYRNRQYVYNAINLQSWPESKVGDGNTQSWALAYPVDSITSLLLDGTPQTWGVQGVDSGRNFYYLPGQNALSADSSLFPEQGAQIALVYIARVPYTSMRESTAQQAILAAVDGSTGIVEASEDCGGLPAAAADVIAQARIDANAILSVDWEYFTSRSGLAPGQLQTMFVPEHGLNDVDMLITEITTALWLDGSGNLQYEYDVKATSGANIGTWQRIFALA